LIERPCEFAGCFRSFTSPVKARRYCGPACCQRAAEHARLERLKAARAAVRPTTITCPCGAVVAVKPRGLVPLLCHPCARRIGGW